MRYLLFVPLAVFVLTGCGQPSAKELAHQACRGELENLNEVDLSKYGHWEGQLIRELFTVYNIAERTVTRKDWENNPRDVRCTIVIAMHMDFSTGNAQIKRVRERFFH